jgi:hypothetical protein
MATAFQNLVPRIMGDLILDFGLSPIQAAAVLGNLAHESAGFTAMQERNPVGGGRGGLGWAQWTGPRRRAFEAWVSKKGFAPDSYAANYGYLKAELSGAVPGFDYRHAIEQLKKTSTIQAATETFEAFYEKAGVKAMASRVAWANKAYDIWKNRRPPPPPVTKPIDVPRDIAAQFSIVAQLAELQNSGTVLSAAQSQALLAALLVVKAWTASQPALRATGEPAPMPSVYDPPSKQQTSSPAPLPSSSDLPEPKPQLQTRRVQGLAVALLGLIGSAIARKWFPNSEGMLQSFLVDYGGEITTAAGVLWAYIGNRMADAPIAGTRLAQDICNVKGMLANAERNPPQPPDYYNPSPPQPSSYPIQDADAPAQPPAPIDLSTAPIEDVVEQLPAFFERVHNVTSTVQKLMVAQHPTQETEGI